MNKAEAANTGKPRAACWSSAMNVLFLALFPVVLWLFQGSAALAATALVLMFLLATALRLILVGQLAAQRYDAAQIARRPRFPRKIVGSVLIGVVVLILAGHHFASLALPILMGALATGLSLAAFGPDPLRDKGFDNPEMVARIEADRIVSGIEDALAHATHRVAGLGDTDLTRRTQAAQDMVLRLIRSLGNEPADIMRLQKPATKFARLLQAEVDRLETCWEGEQYLFARRRYVAKLEVMSESFETHLRKGGARSGQDAYDLEADILLDRMRHESAA